MQDTGLATPSHGVSERGHLLVRNSIEQAMILTRSCNQLQLLQVLEKLMLSQLNIDKL